MSDQKKPSHTFKRVRITLNNDRVVCQPAVEGV